MRQLPLALLAPPVHNFDNFLPGANAEALHYLDSLTPGGPPVLLWGPTGAGKTHLLRALAERWQAAGLRAAWYDAATPLPWELPAHESLLLLDDCQNFDAGQQHAAFALFVASAGQGYTVVATADAPASELTLREDLRTRLGWGPSFQLAPLSEPEMRAALRREADRRGLLLGDEVLSYLLTRFERNLKGLMQLLERLDDFAMSSKRALTLPLLRQMLADEKTEAETKS
ncbi:MAG: DnaA regulatory inactivator Hda [Roseateles depolymerans]|uniref:DnaA regulatory inactivator Hda n=1 Tax=Roseateles depolymerans TaxID=76731 RepID=A0A2W5DG84_9BURK|nr:MAG: DnaA regulatory inactivator Hda [Roseateles depolymerans]